MVDKLVLEMDEVRDQRQQNAQLSTGFVNQISEGINLLETVLHESNYKKSKLPRDPLTFCALEAFEI